MIYELNTDYNTNDDIQQNMKYEDNYMIYKIDHYYNINHEMQCLLIKTNIQAEDLVKVLGRIQLKFEELIDDSETIDERHLLRILKKFYGVQDVKNEYKKYLPCTYIEKADWKTVNMFHITYADVVITQIDLYAAREVCWGKGYKKIMNQFLPNDKQLEIDLKRLYI